jgi:hypothetical protein
MRRQGQLAIINAIWPRLGLRPPDTIEAESVRALAEEARAMAPVEAPGKAKKLRDRAEECRALAQMMTCKVNTTFYLNIAEIYD